MNSYLPICITNASLRYTRNTTLFIYVKYLNPSLLLLYVTQLSDCLTIRKEFKYGVLNSAMKARYRPDICFCIEYYSFDWKCGENELYKCYI